MKARLLELVHIQDNITHMNEAGQVGEMFEIEKANRKRAIDEIVNDYETLLFAIERIESMTHPKYIGPSSTAVWNVAQAAKSKVTR